MRTKIFLSLLATLLLASAPVAMAADTMLRVVTIKTTDVGEYLRQLERGKAIMKQAGSPGVIRVWQARFAGPDAGQIVIAVEYPNMQAFANDNAKLQKNAEFVAWLMGLEGVRRIVSDSLYDEL